MRTARKNKTSTVILQNNVKKFGTKLDQLSILTKATKEEQERIKNLVKNWEVKQKGLEEELSFVGECGRKNNLLIFGMEEYPHESYIDMIKIW
jgi:hypothetical protein